jgi:hypothetical protein
MGTYGEGRRASMGGKLIFGAGVGIGYLLGTRAGRERYEKISSQAKRFWENDTVQEAAASVQEQAERLYDGSKKMLSEQAHKMRDQRHEKQDKRHDSQLRRREFNERSRKDTEWGTPVGYPANPTGPTTTAPY